MIKIKMKSLVLIVLALIFLIFDFVLLKDIINTKKTENKKNNFVEFLSTDSKKILENKLYPVYKMKKDKIVFINKYGKPVFEVNEKEYTDIGEFNEGYVFLGKAITKINEEYNIPDIVQYTVFDSNGNKVMTLKPFRKFFPSEGNSTPVFIDGKANIIIGKRTEVEDDIAEEFYITIKGEKIPYQSPELSLNTSPSLSLGDYPYHEGVKRFDNSDATKYGYITEDGRIIKEPIYECPPPGFDYWSPDFANGVALVKLNGKFGYINKNGEYIIKPTLEYAQSFSNQSLNYSSFGSAYLVHDLAYVVSDTREGYINTKGEFVWSIPKQQY